MQVDEISPGTRGMMELIENPGGLPVFFGAVLTVLAGPYGLAGALAAQVPPVLVGRARAGWARFLTALAGAGYVWYTGIYQRPLLRAWFGMWGQILREVWLRGKVPTMEAVWRRMYAPAPWPYLALAAGVIGGSLLAWGVRIWCGPEQRAVRKAQLAVMAETPVELQQPAARQRPVKDPPDGVALGRDASGRQVAIADKQANCHVVLLGASGAGKTTTLKRVVQSAIRRGKPVFLVDAKGDPDLAEWVRQAAEQAGRRARVWTFSGPEVYNPLAHKGPSDAKDLLVSVEKWTEPHYQRSVERYVQLEFRLLSELGQDYSLDRAIALLQPHIMRQLLTQCQRSETTDTLSLLLGAKDSDIDPSLRSALAGMANRLAVLTESGAGRWFGAGPQAFDLITAYRQREVVVFSLDSLRYPELVPYAGALMLQDLRCLASWALSAPQDERDYCHVVIDEFGSIASAAVLTLVAQARAAGLCCWLSAQEVAQLRQAHQEGAEVVLGSVGTLVIHRQQVQSSCEFLAGMLGTRDAGELTVRVSSDPREQQYTAGSWRRTKEYRLHPDQIRSLGVGEAFVAVLVGGAGNDIRRIRVQAI